MGPAAILSVLVNADTQQATERLSKYDRQLREVQGVARHGVETRLGASFDPKAFAAYEARLSQAARRAKDRAAFKAELGASFNNAGFNAYERAVEKARREGQRLAADQEAVQSRMRRAASSFFKSGSSNEPRSFVRGTVRSAVGHGAGFLGGGLLGGLAGYVSVEGIKSSIEGTTELVKQATILAHYTGMSAQTALQFQGVASALGVSSKSLGMGFRTLATAMNTAITKPTKASTLAFRELGLSQADVKAHSKDLGGMFGVIADRLNALPAGAERTALAAKLLGRNWQGLAPLLMQGSKGMEEQLKQAKALGVTLGGDPLKNIGKLHEAEINLKLAQEGLSVQFTEHVAPALIKVTMGAIKLASTVRRDLTPVFRDLSPVVRDVGHWLKENKGIVEGVAIAFVGLKVIRTVGGWFGGLYNDGRKLFGFMKDVGTLVAGQGGAWERLTGVFRGQQAETEALTVSMNELAASMERVSVIQKTMGGALPIAGGAGPAVATAEGATALGGAGAAETGLLAGGAGLAAKGALGVAGKVFLPLTAVMGLFSALSGKGGGVGGFAGRFLSGATMGLVPSDVFSGGPSDAHQRQQGRQRGQYSFGNFAATQQGTAAGQNILSGQGIEQYQKRLAALNRQIKDATGHEYYDAVDRKWIMIGRDQKVVLDRQAQLNTLTKNFAREQAGALPAIEGNIRALMGGSRFQSAGSIFKQITPELDKLTGKFQNAGAMSALAYARSLERNGRLPRGATDKLIRDLERKFPAFAAYLGRVGVTGMRSLGDALDVRHLQGRTAALINGFRKTFGWLPSYAGTAGRSTQAKMQSTMASLRTIIAHGSAAQRAAAIPMLQKLVSDYQGYMAAIKTASADAEKSARVSIQRLGGDWRDLGSVIETVIDKMILPSVNAAAGAINGLLGLSSRLPQTHETQQQLQHAARAAALGVHPNAAVSSTPARASAPVWNTPTAHHARRAASSSASSSSSGWSSGGSAPMRYYQHHPIGKMTEAQYQAWQAAHAKSVAAAQKAIAALGNAPSQTVAAQITMATLANTLQVAQNDQNIPAQQKALNAELKLEKAWMGEDKRRLARIMRMLKARGLSAAKRAQLQQARLSILQEIGSVAGSMGSTMSALAGLGDSTGSGSFDLAPTGASIRMPTLYDVRSRLGPGRHAGIHKGISPTTHHTSNNTITITVSKDVDLKKMADVLADVTGAQLTGQLQAAGLI